MYKLHPKHVPLFFTGDKTIYRILATGQYRPITFLSGGKLYATVAGERIAAADIAWCLHYGNWPKYPLAQVDGDPLNCSINNLFPKRVKSLRYTEVVKGGQFYHSMSRQGFPSSQLCRLDWAAYAREHYMADLAYVLREEAAERALREAANLPVPALPEAARKREPKPRKAHATSRPAAVEGMEWHWWEGAWLLVPAAVHVADDYMVRCRKWLLGARRFAFQPDYSEVWGFREDGTVVLEPEPQL